MENVLSSAEQDALVLSFLEIAVGQSAEVTRHFLQATNWRIEDAMQLFYTGGAGQLATCSSHVPLVGYTPPLSDHNRSELEEHIWNVNARSSHADETKSVVPAVMDFSSVAVALATLLSGAVATPSAFAPITAHRKRRNRAEMAAAASSFMLDVVNPGSDVPTARRARRSRAQSASSVALSGPCAPVSKLTPATRRQRRTAAEVSETIF